MKPRRRFKHIHPKRVSNATQRSPSPPGGLTLLGLIISVLAWMLVPAPDLAVSLPPPHRPPAQLLPWLSTGNGAIVDDAHNHVLLRGFNSETLLQYSDRAAAKLDDSDAQLMEQNGFDVVRLPISWSRIEPKRGFFDDGYIKAIDKVVSMLNRHKIYVVLDMHFLDWGPQFGGAGAPTWASLSEVPDWAWGLAQPWGRHLSPAPNAATTYFWTSNDWQKDFFEAWQLVAKHFAGHSGVAGYDLYNEPHPLPLPPIAFERQFMWPLYAKTIAAIGQVDSNHLFFIEGTLLADFGTATTPLKAPNLVYAPHIYTGSLVAPSFNGNPTAINNHLQQQENETRAVAAGTQWEGELGIDHQQARSTEWADKVLDAMDGAQIGWAWWQWRQDQSWGIRDDKTGVVDVAFLRHVARPYVISASAGIRGGQGNGVDGHLRIKVVAGRGGNLIVAWPADLLNPKIGGNCPVQTSSWSFIEGRIALILGPSSKSCDLEIVHS